MSADRGIQRQIAAKSCKKCRRFLPIQSFSFYVPTRAKSAKRRNICVDCVKNPGWHRVRMPGLSIASRREQNPVHFWATRTISAVCARARKKRLDCDLILGSLLELYRQSCGCCPVCKVEFDMRLSKGASNSPSVDRILPEYGYIEGNVQLLCVRCNALKGGMTLEQAQTFVEMMKQAQARMYWVGPLDSDE